jgi:RNA polymerase sigma-70 factor (ECF subfamily)
VTQRQPFPLPRKFRSRLDLCNLCLGRWHLLGVLSIDRPDVPLRLVHATDETELVARCVAGDPVAQRTLFERERGRIHRLLYRVVGSNAQLDDLIQDAFLEVFRSLPGFRGESSLRTWIDRCAVRVAYAHFKRKRRHPVLQAVAEEVSDAPNVEERTSMREAVRRFYAELNRLEPHQRIAFTLFAIEGRNQRDVADITSSTVATVKIRVWRARRALEERARRDPLLAEFLTAPQKDGTE